MSDTTQLLPRARNPLQAILALGLLLLLYTLQSKLFRAPMPGFVEIDTQLDLRQILEIIAIGLVASFACWRLPRLGLRLNVTTLLFAAFVCWIGLTSAWSFSPGLTALRAVEFASVTLLIVSLLDAYDDPVDGMLVLSLFWILFAIATLLGSVVLQPVENVYEATRSTTDGFVAAFVIGALLARRRSMMQTVLFVCALFTVLLFYRSIGTLVAAGAITGLALAIVFAESFVGRRPVALVAGILLLVSAVLILAPFAGELVKLIGILFGREMGSLDSLTGRTDIWVIIVPKLLDDPQIFLIGGGHVAGDRVMVFDWVRDFVRATLEAGEHDFGLASHTHNLVLGAIANIGVVGLLLLVALYFIAPVAVLAKRGQSPELSFLVICLAFILINGISENILSYANLLATGTLAFILSTAGRARHPLAHAHLHGISGSSRPAPARHQPAQ